MNNRILFISWDGPYVTYLEGLFLPIFSGLKKYGYDFHILHFSWADSRTIARISNACSKANVSYRHVPVRVQPHPVIGKFLTLLLAHRHVLTYLEDHKIDVVMPRTTMPSRIVLAALRKKPDLKVVFDADGLPIEERLDFTGLKKNSFRYRQLKKIEKQIVSRADVILARSRKAIDFLVQQYGEEMRKKFHLVINGRDESLFQKSSAHDIRTLRTSLGIPEDAFVSVYCGSLGPQYGTAEMVMMHDRLLSLNPNSYWLILTGNLDYFSRQQMAGMRNVIVRKVLAHEVPQYLSIAQIGYALRKATFSMQGVAPVKLGEYLLVGLPVIASAGIGDTEDIVSHQLFCFVLKDFAPENLEQAVEWIVHKSGNINALEARKCGEEFFGLKNAIESYHKALTQLNW